ncbi:MAG: hypothetical protein ACJ77K_06775 [Bacteroidia bacterium]
MEIVTNISIILLLVVVIVQDLYYRRISAWLIPALFVGFLFRGMTVVGASAFFSDALFNLGFVAVQLGLMWLYFILKNRRWINIVDTFIGLGDLLFFIVLCTAFSPVNFIFFFISALICSLFSAFLYDRFVKRMQREVPLAGIMASVLIVTLISCSFLSLGLYDDSYLLNYFLNV